MVWKTLAMACGLLALLLSTGCSKKCKPNEDAECWIKALKDPEQVDKAIDNLKAIGDKKAEPALIEIFQAAVDKPEQRERIAEVFGRWSSKAAVKPMIDALDFTVGQNKDGRKAKRTNLANEKIASALGASGDPAAAQPLLRLMNSTKEATVQRAAVRALAKLKTKDAVDELIKIVEEDAPVSQSNRIIRSNAIFALGEIGDPKSIPALVIALYREKAAYFFHAGLALVKIGEAAIDPLVKAMNGENPEVKKILEQNQEVLTGAMESNAAKTLGDIGSEKAVEPLMELIKKLDKWEETNRDLVMTRIMVALGGIGDKRGVAPILKYLDKELWDVRTICARALNSIGDRSVIPEMFKKATTGQHPRVRAPLYETIGNLGTDEHLAQLKELEKTQKDETVAEAIKLSLARLGAYAQCKTSVDCWVGKLADPMPAVREKAAYELGRLGDSKALDALLKKIDDESEDVRFALIYAFDRIRSKKGIDPIEELIEKEKDSARYNVVNFNYKLLVARLSRTGQ